MSAQISFSTPIPPASLNIPVVLDVAFVVLDNTIEPLDVLPLDITLSNVSTSVYVAVIPDNPLPSP